MHYKVKRIKHRHYMAYMDMLCIYIDNMNNI